MSFDKKGKKEGHSFKVKLFIAKLNMNNLNFLSNTQNSKHGKSIYKFVTQTHNSEPIKPK